MTMTTKCQGGQHEQEAYWEYDARGIPLCKVCDACRAERLSRYRPEVRSNPNYEADENIEPDEDLLDFDRWGYL